MKMKTLCGLALGALASTQVEAQFTPIPLAAGSYTHDIVVEKAAPHPYVAASTASMDGGTNNTGSTWYEVGYNIDSPTTGIPEANTVVTSESAADHTFRMPADYTINNALMIDQGIREGRLTLTSAAAYSGLSLLASAANGSVGLNYTITFVGGATETGTVTAPDWFGGTPVAITARGRVTPTGYGFSAVDTDNPRLYAVDIPVVNTAAIQSIDFSFNTGGANGRAGIFAVSGLTGAEYTPIAVTGFNQDMIVEAGATRPAPIEVTDASMDGGTANTGASWYEQGYNLQALTTGLPQAGTTLTNVSAPENVYRMAASYTATPNAVLIDTSLPTGTLTFATAANQSALSLLGSAGGGAVTLNYDIVHTDSSVQTGTIVIPDWFNAVPFAFTTRGRVGVDSGIFSAVNTDNPRLYSVDIAVERTTVPISHVTLTHVSGGGHVGILALSGTAGAVRPIFDVQPIATTNVFEGSATELTATVSGTAPITFQWQREVNGIYENVSNSAGVTGANTATVAFSNPALTNSGNYRILASNVAGVSTSLVSRLNVFTTTQDITAPGDTVTSIGGATPDNEPVANAIDNTTSKYLNFGADGDQANPYVGPTGLTVTPQIGSTVVTALRLYTANDAADRDPADFTLEGSNDGTTFNVIASGPLALPTGRNDAALDLDPLTQDVQEIHFANGAGYTTYRLTFTNVRNNATVNSMQIGEIELLGVQGTGTPTGPRLSIARSGTDVTISWDDGGTLQATPTLANPEWTTVPGSSPVTVPTSGNYRFFRVVR